MEEDANYPPLPDWVRPGASFCFNFSDPKNINHGRTFYVRAIVDNRAVLREWSKHNKRWSYSVEPLWFFEADFIQRRSLASPQDREEER